MITLSSPRDQQNGSKRCIVTLSPPRTSEAPGAQAVPCLRPGWPWHPDTSMIATIDHGVRDATRVPWPARTYVSGACLVQYLAKTQLGDTTFCPLARCAAPPRYVAKIATQPAATNRMRYFLGEYARVVVTGVELDRAGSTFCGRTGTAIFVSFSQFTDEKLYN